MGTAGWSACRVACVTSGAGGVTDSAVGIGAADGFVVAASGGSGGHRGEAFDGTCAQAGEAGSEGADAKGV